MIRTTFDNNNIIKSHGTFSRNVVQLLQDTWYSCYERFIPVYVFEGQEYMCDWFYNETEEQEINLFGV